MLKGFTKAMKEAGIMTVAEEVRFYRNKYDGKPCKVCGDTLRFKSNKRCVTCKQELDAAAYQRRKAAKAVSERHGLEVA